MPTPDLVAAEAIPAWRSLLGGLMIGTGVVGFAHLSGRVADTGRLLANLLPRRPSTEREHEILAYLAGMLFAGPLCGLTGVLQLTPPIDTASADLPVLLGAGLLAGYGNGVAGGGASGHTLCGLAGGWPRSFVATLAAAVTAIAITVATRLLGDVA